jgi:RNA polymerase sigma-70 factor (ECF subfamily)
MTQRDPHGAPDEPGSAEAGGRHRAQFDEAIRGFRAELLGYLRRRTRDAETAADLTQETFSRMLAYRDAPNIESHALLMYRIAHNLVLELQRTRGRRHAARHVSLGQAGPLYAAGPPVEEIVDARRSLDLLLRRTLVELPPKCRLAFKLSRFDGLTYPQVAARMGISVKMVEKHVSRALLACRAAVEGRHE